MLPRCNSPYLPATLRAFFHPEPLGQRLGGLIMNQQGSMSNTLNFNLELNPLQVSVLKPEPLGQRLDPRGSMSNALNVNSTLSLPPVSVLRPKHHRNRLGYSCSEAN